MSRLAKAWLLGVLVIAALGPLLANDAPLVARVDGQLRFPAFASYFGTASIGPYPDSSMTWREWWLGGDEFAILPPWPYGPLMERQLDHRNEPPSLEHPLGTDDIGRDLLSRMIWGASTGFWIGLGALLVALAIGVPLGALAGYRGGTVDRCVSLVIEIFLCFPALFLVLCAAAMVGSSMLAVILVLGIVYWTGIARLVRGELLSLRQREFVLAARGLGVGTTRLLIAHLLPQVTGPLRVNAAFVFASALIVEATLSFLGLGTTGTGESWGTILALGKDAALRGGAWHLWLFPSLALVVTVCCLHAVADSAQTSRSPGV